MRRLFCVLAAVLALAGCGMSNEDIGSTVQQSMQQKFDTDSQLKEYKLKVGAVQVVKQGENSYLGMAHVQYSGEMQDVPVDIAVDGKSIIWNARPGAFMFIAQREIQKIFAPRDVSMPPAEVTPAANDAAVQLKDQEAGLNDKCRGGSGDDPATNVACTQRDAVMAKLKGLGWCWGHEGQINADMTWERCPGA